MPAPFVRSLTSPRSHDFVGIMSRSAHARDAYPGISYRLWRSSRIHRTLVTSVTLVLHISCAKSAYLLDRDLHCGANSSYS